MNNIHPTITSADADANSRLICAAPDLLALCKRLKEMVDICRGCADPVTGQWDVLDHEYAQLLISLEQEAIEAIAKAEGGN